LVAVKSLTDSLNDSEKSLGVKYEKKNGELEPIASTAKYVTKRDGKLEPFDRNHLMNSIYRASKAVGLKDSQSARELTDQVVRELEKQYEKAEFLTVEEIQDATEKILIMNGYAQIAKAYILYRKQHQDIRELASLLSSADLVDQYLEIEDLTAKGKNNPNYSVQGLNNYVSSTVIAKYWVTRIYSERIVDAHFSGDMHIHDLGVLEPYTAGWDISELLMSGLSGVAGKIEVASPHSLHSALDRIVNFFYMLRGELGAAQELSDFDTYLAPFIRYDNLSQSQVEELLQAFIINMNMATCVGFQPPFSNLAFDLTVPKFMEEEYVIFDGKTTGDTYGDFSKEMEVFNSAFADVMSNGDLRRQVFTFPIPTYNITKDFSWDSAVARKVFELSAKFGSPYFRNYANSDKTIEDERKLWYSISPGKSSELRHRGGGYFGANPLTGSVGTVTINMPRIGYLSKDEDEYFERLESVMDIASSSLEIKRKALETFTENGLYPYSRRYLRNTKAKLGEFWKNHFSTIGLVGMNESVINLFGENIASRDGLGFAIKTLTFMRKRLIEYQEKTGNIYNLEATPAEGTSYRLARIDTRKYRDIIVANMKQRITDHAEPFYTNSSQLPVDFAGDLFQAIEHQENLQTLYTGGTVFHIFLRGRLDGWRQAADLIRNVTSRSRLPYFTLTPTFSICPNDGYLSGEYIDCPKCNSKCQVYSRVAGYLRPVDQWNDGKQAEFRIRKCFDVTTLVSPEVTNCQN
jgi:ribonucleoside-triphosphate reductase